MRTLSAAAIALWLMLPRAAMGQGTDAAVPDAGGGCGAVTPQGSCTGNVVTYCDINLNRVITIDCPMTYTPTTICTQIDPTVGFRCAEAVGQNCLFIDHGTKITLHCQGMNAGCLEQSNNARCTASIGPCMLPQIGTCSGN